MSYKAICLTRLTGQPLILSNHFTCRQQTVVDWVETFTKRLAEAFSNFELPGRGEQPEPVAWVDDETLGLFKPIHGALPGEEFYLLCFLSSFQTPVALEAFEKVHGYVQGIMRIPSENIKVQFRHIEIESALQDIFSKLIYLSRKLDLDQANPSPSALEASITRMYSFRSLANPTSLQLLNRPALIHCHSANSDKGRRSKYAWVKPTPVAPRNAEEIEAIHDISRTLAAEVKIGSKKDREETLETVYEKVLGELAVNKDKFDLGDILKTPGAGSSQGGQTRPEGGFEIDGPNEDKESNGKKDGQFVDQEQLQEEVEFFKGMLSGSSPDADTGFSGQFKFEFEQKTEKVHDDYVIELPRETHGDPTLNLGDATPHKTVLENNLINSYNATISFDRTEHNSPGTRSPVFKWESDPDHLFQFNNPDSEVQVPESNESHQPPQQTVPFMHFEPPKQETSSEGFNFPDINVKKKRAKIFDDEDQAVVPSPIQQNTQENWKFNERPSEGSRVHSPFQPQVYGFPPQEESHSFNIGENSGLPGAVSDQKPTEVPTIRQPKLPDFSTGDFDLPPPPTDSSGQVEDNGFGGFELGWKKQKHNFMDNEPDSQPYRPPQMIEQPAGSNPVILGPYPPQAEQPNFQTNPAHNPYIQGPVHVFPHPAMFNTPYPVHAHQGPQDYPPSPIFHPPGSNIGWQPPVEVPQPKQPTFMPLDNFDLLSLEVVPTELIKPQDNTSRKQVVNPFEDSPEKETPSLQPIIDVPKQTEIAPKLTEKPIVEVKKLAPEAPIPSLNNFRVLQQEILTYQEQSGKSTLELTGCLLLKADQGIATKSKVSVLLEGELWANPRLVKTWIPTENSMRVHMPTASRLEVSTTDTKALGFLNYSLANSLLDRVKLPSLMKYQLHDKKSLTLKLFTNKLYSAYSLAGAKIIIRASKPLNKFQFEASRPHSTIVGKDIEWHLDALNYGEAVELTFTINEFSVVIEGLEVRAILPISYDQKMLLTIKDSSHLPLHVPKDFDLQKNYIRRLNFVCIIKV